MDRGYFLTSLAAMVGAPVAAAATTAPAPLPATNFDALETAEGRAAPAHRGHVRARVDLHDRRAQRVAGSTTRTSRRCETRTTSPTCSRFLNVYYHGMEALRVEQDFYDLTIAYLKRVQVQGVRHAEIFFDPQAHTKRGVEFAVVVEGIVERARRRREEIRHHLASDHVLLARHVCRIGDDDTGERAAAQGKIIGVGLDSAEVGNPPSKFTAVFDRARAEGFLTVAHAGEEAGPDYVWEALNLLKVSRVDHGVRSLDDPNARRPSGRRTRAAHRLPALQRAPARRPEPRRASAQAHDGRGADRARATPTIPHISADTSATISCKPRRRCRSPIKNSSG